MVYAGTMRPEILFPLFAPSSALKGVGPKIAPLVERLAGPRVRDVLFLPPSGVITRSRTTVSHALEGEVQTFLVRIEAHQPARMAPTGFCFTRLSPKTLK